MNYLSQLQELDSLVFYNMHKTSQLTIDLVQNAILDFGDIESENDADWELLMSTAYRVSTTIEIFNPALSFDVAILLKLKTILNNWANQVDFVNKSLGINDI
jgi:hypothetical protein